MKYSFETSSKFKSSFKRVRSYRNYKESEYIFVVDTLLAGKSLPPKYKDHQLHGNMKDIRECHVANDIVLVYQYKHEVLVLLAVNIGSHSELFA